MDLKISIFGLGYAGSVSAACFASLGHNVIGVDVNPSKVDMIETGRSPIIEAGMNEMIAAAHAVGRLHATTEPGDAVLNSDISFICVGTPGLPNGKLDLSHIEKVAYEIGTALRTKRVAHTIVVRSTVLPGATESVILPAIKEASGRCAGTDFMMVYNPEFMREGSAVADFWQPPYVVLGAQQASHLEIVRRLYAGISAPVFETSIPVAEMVKYASNAFHAVKVTFANEIGTLCKNLDVDAQAVTEIFTSDRRLNISPVYLSPGFAFGGSCLPKDVRALTHRARELDLNLPMLGALLPSNAEHVERAFSAIVRSKRKKVAQVGLSFKPGTDDLRESPHVQLVKRLLGEGFEVRIWDQGVTLGRLAGSNRQYIEEVIPHIGSLLSVDLEDVLQDAHVVILGNKSVSKEELEAHLRADQIVIDLVHLDAAERPKGNFQYEGICW